MNLNIEDLLGVSSSVKGAPVVLVDYSHLSHRNLFIAKVKIDSMSNNMFSFHNLDDYNECLPGNPLKSAALVDMYYHMMLRSIIGIKKQFKIKSENIILCRDDRSWRKNVYVGYKAHRAAERDKSDLDWNAFYKDADKLFSIIESNTKIKVLQVPEAEADDLLYVLAENLSKSNPITVVTSDKDLKQILRFSNVSMYDPLKREMVKDWVASDLLSHILCGDSGDGVPSIKDGAEFEPSFISHLKRNFINLSKVEDVTKLEVFKPISESYDGKIYKPGRFAEGGAKKVIQTKSLRNVLKENPIFKRNFIRNRLLIDLRKIPKYISTRIMDMFDSLPQKKNNMFDLQDWLVKHKLKEVQKDMQHLLN